MCIDPSTRGRRTDVALGLVRRLLDGWIATWCSAQRFAAGTEFVEETAAASGRAPEWQHGMQLWIGVGADTNTATGFVAARMEAFYHVPFEAFAAIKELLICS